MATLISLERSFEPMVLRKTEFIILYWLNGEELQDCICDNYDEAKTDLITWKPIGNLSSQMVLLRSSWLISILIQSINLTLLLINLIGQIWRIFCGWLSTSLFMQSTLFSEWSLSWTTKLWIWPIHYSFGTALSADWDTCQERSLPGLFGNVSSFC